jgi:transketolase
MSEVKKIATRASYGSALVELGKKHENLIVLDADLAAATQTGMFKKEFPERHIDCGIAECNMMGIAAGLANCFHRQGSFCKYICYVCSRTCL